MLTIDSGTRSVRARTISARFAVADLAPWLTSASERLLWGKSDGCADRLQLPVSDLRPTVANPTADIQLGGERMLRRS